MATYQVPPDISEKEKIVGGVLTAAQLVSILVFVGIAVVFSFALMPVFGNGIIIVSLVLFLPMGAAFSFLKIKGLSLFMYLKLKKQRWKAKKQLINEGIKIRK